MSFSLRRPARWLAACASALVLAGCADLGIAPNDPIVLDSDVLFEFGKADLKPEGKRQIDQYIPSIKARGETRIEVIGHTDRIGSRQANDALSLQRAQSVRNQLIAGGLDPDQVRARGLGSRSPVVQCADQNRDALIRCLAPNRRVQINVTDIRW